MMAVSEVRHMNDDLIRSEVCERWPHLEVRRVNDDFIRSEACERWPHSEVRHGNDGLILHFYSMWLVN